LGDDISLLIAMSGFLCSASHGQALMHALGAIVRAEGWGPRPIR
jgi:hypothetical protein